MLKTREMLQHILHRLDEIDTNDAPKHAENVLVLSNTIQQAMNVADQIENSALARCRIVEDRAKC